MVAELKYLKSSKGKKRKVGVHGHDLACRNPNLQVVTMHKIMHKIHMCTRIIGTISTTSEKKLACPAVYQLYNRKIILQMYVGQLLDQFL